MFENIVNFFKKFNKKEEKAITNSREAAKERLHLVLMQDRANVSADFLELMKQEIIEVIKKYIDVDETAIDVKLTNQENEDGTNGAPALYANIPILHIKNEAKKVEGKQEKKDKAENTTATENKEVSLVKEEKEEKEQEEKQEANAETIKEDDVVSQEESKQEEQQEKKETLKSEEEKE